MKNGDFPMAFPMENPMESQTPKTMYLLTASGWWFFATRLKNHGVRQLG